MRCIFCKRNSTGSRSVEHILPQSLGNEEHVLPPGVVCDACNNYFATSIEQVVLESGEFKTARFNMIPNKRKRVPILAGMLLPGIARLQSVQFHRAEVSRNTVGSFNCSRRMLRSPAIADGRINRVIIPARRAEAGSYRVFPVFGQGGARGHGCEGYHERAGDARCVRSGRAS